MHAVVWIVDVRDGDVSHRFRFASEDAAAECYASAVRAGFDAVCERVMSRVTRTEERCLTPTST
jgi:hypothetical protein